MVNKNFLKMAERQKNSSLSNERIVTSIKNTNSPDLPTESFIMSYDGIHGNYFQELIAKLNKVYSGTGAEIPAGTSGEVKKMYSIKRMALVSTIANNPSLQSQRLYPITPIQHELLLKVGKLPDSNKSFYEDFYWEDLALLLYDTTGNNSQEAQALKESIIQHRTDLGLSQSDLESRLVIVNAGGEVDLSMPHKVKPIIIPGITQVYIHEVLDKTGENHKFEYGLDRGLPTVSKIGNGSRTLYMPNETCDVGLRVLCRFGDSDLYAWKTHLDNFISDGRVTFAPQVQISKK